MRPERHSRPIAEVQPVFDSQCACILAVSPVVVERKVTDRIDERECAAPDEQK